MPRLTPDIEACIRRTVSAVIERLRAANPGRDVDMIAAGRSFTEAVGPSERIEALTCYINDSYTHRFLMYPGDDRIDITTFEDIVMGKRVPSLPVPPPRPVRRIFTQQEWEYIYIDRITYATGDTFKRWLVTCPICTVGDVSHSDGHSTCSVCVPAPAATGPTQRLARVCAVCGDELPADAVFCIACGAATAAA